MKILPQFYHTLLEKQLKPQDLITLEILVWLIQTRVRWEQGTGNGEQFRKGGI